MEKFPSLKLHNFCKKTTLFGLYKKEATLNEKLVALCYHDYSFICNCSRHICVICVLLKFGVEFGLNLEMLYCLELDEYPYRIFHTNMNFTLLLYLELNCKV